MTGIWGCGVWVSGWCVVVPPHTTTSPPPSLPPFSKYHFFFSSFFFCFVFFLVFFLGETLSPRFFGADASKVVVVLRHEGKAPVWVGGLAAGLPVCPLSPTHLTGQKKTIPLGAVHVRDRQSGGGGGGWGYHGGCCCIAHQSHAGHVTPVTSVTMPAASAHWRLVQGAPV